MKTSMQAGSLFLFSAALACLAQAADVTTGPLAEKGPDDVPALIEALNDEIMGRRWNAALVLGEIGDESATAALIECVKTDEHPRVRRRAMDALGKIGAVDAVPALIAALKSEDNLERRDAARVLGTLGEKSAIPALIETLKDDEGFVRREAARALGRIGDRSAVPALQELAKESVDEYSFDRPLAPHETSPAARAALYALIELGGATGLEAFEEVFSRENEYARMYALGLLGEMGARATETIPAVKPLLADEDTHMRRAAIEALRDIGGSAAAMALAEAFAMYATPWSLQVNRDLRMVAQALGELGYKETLPVLREALAAGEERWPELKDRSTAQVRMWRSLRNAISAIEE